MNETATNSTNSERHNEVVRKMTKARVKFFGITALVTVFFILVFGGIGYYFDYLNGTKPLFLFIGLGLSFIVNQLTMVRIINMLTKK